MSGRCLVTGGAGFIGRHVARLLLERGATVRVLDVAAAPDLAADIEVIRGSVLDAATMTAALKGVDRLYHLAANPNLWAPRAEMFLETNYRGTLAVLEAAGRADLERIVHTSTESILKSYRRPMRGPADESVRWTVDDMPGPYCRSKFLAEQAALQAAAAGLPVVVVNPTMPIGPGDNHLTPPTRMLLGFLNGDIPAYLECAFNLVDVRDAAAGHILAAERGVIGERYILGGTNIRLSELLAQLGRLTGLPMPRRRVPYWLAFGVACAGEALANLTKKPPIAPLTGVRLAHTPMLFDSTKAIRDLGLPQTSLQQTLADAIVWLETRGLLRRPPGALAANAALPRK